MRRALHVPIGKHVVCVWLRLPFAGTFWAFTWPEHRENLRRAHYGTLAHA